MKICLYCGGQVDSPTWRCALCGEQPPAIDGVISFAPELITHSADYPDETIHLLDSLQETSFWFRGRNRLITELALRYAPEPSRIMEIGCGSGYVLGALQRAFPRARLVGSEIYASGLSYARKRVGGDVTLLQMDARKIPYDSEFDIVGAFDVIEHIDDDTLVIAEMARAAKPGGCVMLSVPQHQFLWSGADDYACHKRRYGTTELATKLRAVGLDIVVDTSFVTGPFPAMLIQRLLLGRKAYDIRTEFSIPRWVDRTFEVMLDLERRLIGVGASLPFGGSRVVLARKPGASPPPGTVP